MTTWTWDSSKSRTNRHKHGLSFEKAMNVFDDPLAVSRLDPGSPEERWHTIGVVEGVTIFVVHTWRENRDGDEEGRIISARRATRNEEEAYEEGEF
jgi:hypothetical protein